MQRMRAGHAFWLTALSALAALAGFHRTAAAELGCYAPLCEQGTAFFGRLFGELALDFFLDAGGQEEAGLVGLCAQVRRTSGALLGGTEHCAGSVGSGHVHVPLSASLDQDLAAASTDSMRHAFLQVHPRYVYRNGSSAPGRLQTMFVLALRDYEGGNAAGQLAHTLSTVFVRSPRYGSIHAHAFNMHYTASQPARQAAESLLLSIHHVHEAAVGALTTSMDAQGDAGLSLPKEAGEQASYVSRSRSGSVEPASWFFSIVPQLSSAALQEGGVALPGMGYVEFVLTRAEIAEQRLFATPEAMAKPPEGNCGGGSCVSSQVDATEKEVEKEKPDPINVCVWGSTVPDGQKRIFLQQMQTLPGDFSFTYFLSSESALIATDATGAALPMNDYEQKLWALTQSRDPARPRLQVVRSPLLGFTIPFADLEEPVARRELPDDPKYNDIMRYMASRYRAAGGDIEAISPRWVAVPHIKAREALKQHACDVSVNGNIRGVSAEFLIINAARSLGIPTVSELLNLWVDADSAPDVLVGPSEYSLRHESVSWLATARKTDHSCLVSPPQRQEQVSPAQGKTDGMQLQQHPCGPHSLVLSPGVDTRHFDPDRSDLVPRPLPFEGTCPSQGCPVIAFVARLSSEKNPGLFLLAAHALLQTHPHALFVVAGGGNLLEDLQVLALRLGVASRVTFTGWIAHDDLPSLFRSVDVVVNPSVRGWSETFCIANIEAMAMRVPLVTFAAGGVGQYVHDPGVAQEQERTQEQTGDLFRVGSNAVVVQEASPQALAAAVAALLDDGALRERLGAAGRRTVVEFFRAEQQMWRYEQLYRYLHGARRAG